MAETATNKCSQLGRPVLTANKITVDSVLGLMELLARYNNYFLPYAGSSANTRLLVDLSLRRRGLFVTYVRYDKQVVVEYYDSDNVTDVAWRDNRNWRDASNKLVGDISISQEGNWVVKGQDSGIPATGRAGKFPILRVSPETNTLLYRYSDDTGENWLEVSEDSPIVYTKFRVEENKFQISTDLGRTWEDVSGPISALFRWVEGDFNTVGKIQISRDEGQSWADLSPSILNTLKVQAYYASLNEAPTTAPDGYIIMVGPYYDESNSPKYELYIFFDGGWFDIGSFQSILAGITGQIDENSQDSSSVVPTAEAVVNYIRPTVNRVATLEGQLNGLTIEPPLSETDYEQKLLNDEINDESLYFTFENLEEQ